MNYAVRKEFHSHVFGFEDCEVMKGNPITTVEGRE